MPQQDIPQQDMDKILHALFDALRLKRTDDGRVKLDFDTALESFFFYMGIIGLVLGVIEVLVVITSPDIGWQDVAAYWHWWVLPPGLGMVSLILKYLVDNYYVLVPQQRTVFLSRNFVWYHREIPLARYDDVFAITVQAKFVPTRSGGYLEYFGILLLVNGKQIRISDTFTGDSLERNQGLLENLGEISGLPFRAPLEAGARLYVRKTPVVRLEDQEYRSFQQISRRHVRRTIYIAICFFVVFLLSVVILMLLTSSGT